jgi:hypothetical protein
MKSNCAIFGCVFQEKTLVLGERELRPTTPLCFKP